MRKKKVCSNKYCDEYPYIAGMCQEHYDEQKKKRNRKENANELLRSGLVKGAPISSSDLKQELARVFNYQEDAFYAFRNKCDYGVIPHDEAEAALSWCKGLAEVIFYEELLFRGDENGDTDSSHLREYLWRRFENLEKGLSSNGLTRKKVT